MSDFENESTLTKNNDYSDSNSRVEITQKSYSLRKYKSILEDNERLKKIIKNMNEDKRIRCQYINKLRMKINYLEDTIDRRTCFEIIAMVIFTLFALIVTRFC